MQSANVVGKVVSPMHRPPLPQEIPLVLLLVVVSISGAYCDRKNLFNEKFQWHNWESNPQVTITTTQSHYVMKQHFFYSTLRNAHAVSWCDITCSCPHHNTFPPFPSSHTSVPNTIRQLKMLAHRTAVRSMISIEVGVMSELWIWYYYIQKHWRHSTAKESP